MPSAALLRWRTDRMSSLGEIETQCAGSLALVPSNVRLAEENLRGYVVLLSAHFQGFARDLHTEAAQIIASKVRPSLQLLIQGQFSAHRALDHGNPTAENLARDFGRLGIDLKTELAADPLQHLPRAAPGRPEQMAERGRPSQHPASSGHHAESRYSPILAGCVRRPGRGAGRNRV